MTEPTDVHRCERAERCVAYELIEPQPGRPPQRVGAEATRALCDWCETAVVDALAAAPALYRDLRNATLRPAPTAGMGEFVTRSKGSPLPLNAQALYLTEQVHWLLTTWEDVARDIAGLSSPDRVGKREGRQVADAARLLGLWLPVWLSAPAQEFRLSRVFDNGNPDYHLLEQTGAQAAGALLDWRNAARYLPGLDVTAPKATRRYDQPCPGCGVRAVTHRAGDDLMQCQNCRATHPYEPTLPPAADYTDTEGAA